MNRIDHSSDISTNYSHKLNGYNSNQISFSQYSTTLLIALVLLIAFLSFFKLFVFAIIVSFIAIVLLALSYSRMRKLINENKKHFDDIESSCDNRGKVISDLSHRIRSPLSNLVVLGSVLNGTTMSQKQKDLTETIIASSNNIFHVINELILRSRIDLVPRKRTNIKFNLLNVISSIAEVYSQNHQSIILKTDKSGLINNEIIGDPIILKQIFIYLINKVETAQLGKDIAIDIIIKENKLSEEETKIEFTFITNHQIAFIETTNDSLIPVARLIKANKGSYTQETKVDSTLFTFSLPFILPGPEAAVSTIAKVIDPTRTAITEIQKKKLSDISILLVEDNPINQKIVLIVLSSKVKNIDTAINGQEAVNKFSISKYDIILMDIHMPIMDGLTATKKIRIMEKGKDTHTPIIAVTADAMLGDEEKCLSYGMNDYLSKPFKPAHLIEKIENLIN